MVVNSTRPFWGMLGELLGPLIPVVVYVVAISLLDIQYHLEEYNFPIAIVSVLGTLISLVLAFRTNSSYGRWWEARTLWGSIVNDSRTWTRQLLEFSPMETPDDEAKSTIRRMALRQVAWCYSLSRSLRGQDPTCDLDDLIGAEEIESLRPSQNVPNELLLRQAIELRRIYQDGKIELFQLIELEKTLTRLTNAMGGCERIKNTTFPQSYSRMVGGMIYLFTIILPFGLVSVPALGLVATAVSLAFGFLLIERVAIYLQDPFSNRPSDTPMLTLSRTIEINIKQMLGDSRIPEKMGAIRGVYY